MVAKVTPGIFSEASALLSSPSSPFSLPCLSLPCSARFCPQPRPCPYKGPTPIKAPSLMPRQWRASEEPRGRTGERNELLSGRELPGTPDVTAAGGPVPSAASTLNLLRPGLPRHAWPFLCPLQLSLLPPKPVREGTVCELIRRFPVAALWENVISQWY